MRTTSGQITAQTSANGQNSRWQESEKENPASKRRSNEKSQERIFGPEMEEIGKRRLGNLGHQADSSEGENFPWLENERRNRLGWCDACSSYSLNAEGHLNVQLVEYEECTSKAYDRMK